MATHRFDLGGEEPVTVDVGRGDAAWTLAVDGGDARAVRVRRGAVHADGAVSGIVSAEGANGAVNTPAAAWVDGDAVQVWWKGRVHRVPVVERTARRAGSGGAGAGGDDVSAPMPGTILAIKVATGDAVEADSVVVVMESMKMEMSLPAPRAGTVAEICASEGELVEMGTTLVRLAPETADAADSA